MLIDIDGGLQFWNFIQSLHFICSLGLTLPALIGCHGNKRRDRDEEGEIMQFVYILRDPDDWLITHGTLHGKQIFRTKYIYHCVQINKKKKMTMTREYGASR